MIWVYKKIIRFMKYIVWYLRGDVFLFNKNEIMGILNKKRKKKLNIKHKEKIDKLTSKEIINTIIEEINEPEEEVKSEKINEIEDSTIQASEILVKELEKEFGDDDVNPSPEPPEENKEETDSLKDVDKEETDSLKDVDKEEFEYKKVNDLNKKEYRFYLNTGKLPIKK